MTDIDHVQLAAPRGCEAEARKFFGRLLGLAEVEKPEALEARGGCWFRVGTRQLHIGVAANFIPATKAHPAFGVRDVEALYATLEKAGVECLWDEAADGPRRFYARDPWGNRLEFTEPARTAATARKTGKTGRR
ncbi:MAG TPA: VOC family protein [Verrucomicrobiae bacterium]|nr:VOC family protein [Verrucomicrobiae bacterium]